MKEGVRDHRLGRLDAAEEEHGCVRRDLVAVKAVCPAGGRRDERRRGVAIECRLDCGAEQREAARPLPSGSRPA